MGQGFLKAIRGCLVLLALITIIMAAQFLRISQSSISDPGRWDRWLPLFLAILSVIAYSWALKAKKSIIQSNGIRYTFSFLLCAAWLVSPIRNVIIILKVLRPLNLGDEFFAYWSCNIGWLWCEFIFATDVCGFLMALFVLLEMILAHFYERSSKARKAGTLPTSVVAGPGPVQQYPAQPGQQFVYTPVQPGQPAAYYPQPGMTAPYQPR